MVLKCDITGIMTSFCSMSVSLMFYDSVIFFSLHDVITSALFHKTGLPHFFFILRKFSPKFYFPVTVTIKKVCSNMQRLKIIIKTSL